MITMVKRGISRLLKKDKYFFFLFFCDSKSYIDQDVVIQLLYKQASKI